MIRRSDIRLLFQQANSAYNDLAYINENETPIVLEAKEKLLSLMVDIQRLLDRED